MTDLVWEVMGSGERISGKFSMVRDWLILPVLFSQVPPGGMWEALCLTQQAEAAREGSRGYVQMGTMQALRDTPTAGCACCGPLGILGLLHGHTKYTELCSKGPLSLPFKPSVVLSTWLCFKFINNPFHVPHTSFSS